MDYAEYRKQNAARNTNEDLHDFSWEQEHIPVLHSGLLQPQKGDDTKSVLRLTFYFSQGSYHCLLMDREANEKAFVDTGTLCDGFATIEEAMREGKLLWLPDKYGSR